MQIFIDSQVLKANNVNASPKAVGLYADLCYISMGCYCDAPPTVPVDYPPPPNVTVDYDYPIAVPAMFEHYSAGLIYPNKKREEELHTWVLYTHTHIHILFDVCICICI